MKFCSLILLVSFCLSCSAQVENKSEIHSEMDKLIDQVQADYQIAGMTMAIIDPETGPLIKYVGFLDGRSKVPVNDTSLFSAQSLSKTFTSLACLRAVSDGLLNLDQPISNYLPNFRVHSIKEENAASKITLRHLLSHTSGLPADAPVGNIFNSKYQGSVYAPLAPRVASVNQVWLRTKVGSQYSYSNLGFDLAARIVELVSGTSFDQYVKEKVLLPLNMTHSTFKLDSIPLLKNVAKGHCINYEGKVPVLFSSLGGGGLYTCAKDMLNFLHSALKGFPEILPKELAQEFIEVPFSTEESAYALGLTVNSIQYCSETYGHTGNGFGFTSSMMWIPKYHVAVAILCNRESVYSGIQSIQNAIVNDAMAKLDESLDCQDLHQYPNHIEKDKLAHYRGLTGRYSNGNITLTFEIRDKQFGVLSPSDGSFNPLHFLSDNTWVFKDGEIIMFSYKNEQITNRNNGMSFQKVPDIVEIKNPRPRWGKYVGRYRSYAYGILESTEIIDIENGYLRLNGNVLQEQELGLFFDHFGQIVDFRKGKVFIEYGEYQKIN